MNYNRFFTIIAIVAMCIALFSTCKKDKKDPEEVFEFEPEMIYVEPGTFTMGCTDNDCVLNTETPAHQVTLTKGYYIGKYTVTQAQWEAVMGITMEEQAALAGYSPSALKYDVGDDYPMYLVNEDDIQTFLSKLNTLTGKNYRLPTEAEWEFAARGGNQSKGYKYSGSDNINDVAWYGAYSGGNSGDATHRVGLKQPNELGIYDMSGNVWECCSDWYDVYSEEAQTDPQGPAVGTRRVMRGGTYYRSAQYCRVAYRGQKDPSIRGGDVGFRVALSL